MHFISGLPRSGSTLLAGILRQNPRFHAGMTGPVGTLFGAMLAAMSPQAETALFLDEPMRRDLLRGLFDAYYKGHLDKALVFDTNRAWTARLPALKALFPDAKVVCCVRDVAWVMDSIERLVRKNAFLPSRLFATADERATVFSRVEALAHRDRLVGYAWSALKEAYYGEHSSSLLIVEYDILVQRPKDCLRLVYEFLGETPFDHDFDDVDYDEPEFDRQLATPGLHAVHRKVEWKPRRTVLPPDLYEKFTNLSFWRDPKGSASWRITVQAPEKKAS
ncbi:MAG: sulfotransferase [Geminicoccaceae bacterium]|nr:sulfotransferase [Geminicoccaceae bacterium]